MFDHPLSGSAAVGPFVLVPWSFTQAASAQTPSPISAAGIVVDEVDGAIAGSSTMGGVVNVITRHRGNLGGSAQIGAGSFDASEFGRAGGGRVSSRLDFDAAGSAFDQRDNYRMGKGEVRPPSLPSSAPVDGRMMRSCLTVASEQDDDVFVRETGGRTRKDRWDDF